MAIVLFAGSAKLLDLGRFDADLRSWTLLPAGSTDYLVIIIPSVELILAGSWFGRFSPRKAPLAALVLLVLFTAAFVAHLTLARPPQCSCFGAIFRFESQEHGAEISVVRNLVLLAALTTGILLYRPGHSAQGAPSPRAPVDIPRGIHGRAGFSLIELILVIALIAILLAMTIPSLAGVRQSARRVVSLSNLRTHAQVVTAYADTYKDTFLWTMNPEATYSVRRHPSGIAIQIVYFAGMNTWHWPLLEDFYSQTLDNAIFADPNDKGNYPYTSFWYSSTFLARPDFWNESTRSGPAQWRPVLHSDVLFPSKKAIHLNAKTMFVAPDQPIHPLHLIDVSFVDGAARSIPFSRLTPPYLRGEGNWHGSWFGNGIKVMHTIDGSRGRDEQ
jgi:prepilin-type N-terminal cleavage/methylation domain-containing protein